MPEGVVPIDRSAQNLVKRLQSRRNIVRFEARQEALGGGPLVERAVASMVADRQLSATIRGNALEVLAQMRDVSDSAQVVEALGAIVRDGNIDLGWRKVAGGALARRIGPLATSDLAELLNGADRWTQSEVLAEMAAFCDGSAWEKVFDLLRESLLEKSPVRRNEIAKSAIQYLALHATDGSAQINRLLRLLRECWTRLASWQRGWLSEEWQGIETPTSASGTLQAPPRSRWKEDVMRGFGTQAHHT